MHEDGAGCLATLYVTACVGSLVAAASMFETQDGPPAAVALLLIVFVIVPVLWKVGVGLVERYADRKDRARRAVVAAHQAVMDAKACVRQQKQARLAALKAELGRVQTVLKKGGIS